MAHSVTASAPGKLLLFGEHAVVHGKPCIVTAVDQRLFVTVTLNGENMFRLTAPDMGLEAYVKTIDELGGADLPNAVRFIEMLYKRFLERYPQNRGIDVVTKSEFSASFGFGSSSAATVAFAKALFEVCGVQASNQDLFELCYRAVLDVQGVGSGFDVACAIWGGTLYYVTPGKVIEKLLDEAPPLVVGYTGVKADTPTLIRQVAELKRKEPELVSGIFERIGELVDEARIAMSRGAFEKVGALMQENQRLLSKLHVSSAELDMLIDETIKMGAWGAKLSGAGGGDCMIAIVGKEKKALVEGVVRNNGELMRVNLGAEGVRIEKISEQ